MSFCPLCGQALAAPAATCPHCRGDLSLLTEFGGGAPADDAAKQTVSRFLAGEPVSPGELRPAWDAVKADAEHARHLGRELGLGPGDASLCAAFRSRLAEFTELTPAERDAEFPELVAHVADCGACRQAMWATRSLWDRKERVAELAEPIRLAVSAAGVVRERGGPPGAAVATVFTTAGLLSDDPSAMRREWELRDEEVGGSLKLTVTGSPGGSAALGVKLDVPTPARPPRLEVRDELKGRRHLAGPLAQFGDAINLPPGTWRLAVDADTPAGPRSWAVTLVLGPEE